jgi:hypothetical protein
MHELDLSHALWRKSSYSSGHGQCVEVTHLAEAIAVRDSKDLAGPKLIFTLEAWAAFLRGAKAENLTAS